MTDEKRQEIYDYCKPFMDRMEQEVHEGTLGVRAALCQMLGFSVSTTEKMIEEEWQGAGHIPAERN